MSANRVCIHGKAASATPVRAVGSTPGMSPRESRTSSSTAAAVGSRPGPSGNTEKLCMAKVGVRTTAAHANHAASGESVARQLRRQISIAPIDVSRTIMTRAPV